MLVIAVAAIVFAGLGSLSRTSNRDLRSDVGILLPRSGGAGQRGRGSPSARGRQAAPRTDSGIARRPPTRAEMQLRAALDRTLRLAGPTSGIEVEDLTSQSPLFELRAGVRRPPASVEKLYTTVALLRVLGATARLRTQVLGTGSLSQGDWHGNLYLRGGGDPTFGDATFNRAWERGYGPTASQLVAQLMGQGVRRVTGAVYADESLFDRRRGGMMTAYAPDTPDFGGQLSALTYDHGSTSGRLSPAVFATRELVLTMRAAHLGARAAHQTAPTPPGARLLATVSSPPMSIMTRLMDVPSDDLFAELFTKQLGVLFGSAGSIAAGAQVISRTIAASYGLHPTILDGSGLSRADNTSPREVVDLLRSVWQTPIGNQLDASLPTVGVQGTVATIAVKTAAEGHCIAKTGTLNAVTNLAGYCRSRSGHTLAFAVFIDGPPNYTAVTLESRIIADIARY